MDGRDDWRPENPIETTGDYLVYSPSRDQYGLRRYDVRRQLAYASDIVRPLPDDEPGELGAADDLAEEG
jgi:hypothetical protein